MCVCVVALVVALVVTIVVVVAVVVVVAAVAAVVVAIVAAPGPQAYALCKAISFGFMGTLRFFALSFPSLPDHVRWPETFGCGSL